MKEKYPIVVAVLERKHFQDGRKCYNYSLRVVLEDPNNYDCLMADGGELSKDFYNNVKAFPIAPNNYENISMFFDEIFYRMLK